MNPLSDKQFTRLRTAIDWSNRQFDFPRRKRISAIKQLVGSHYSDGGADKRVPVNFIKLATGIYIHLLAPHAPRVMIGTKIPELKPTASNLELRINQIPDEIGMTAAFRRLVTEALFSFGIGKVGLHSVGEILGHSYGKPFFDVITIDDYFCDMAAKTRDAIQYEGNDYWLDYDAVMESKWFPQNVRNLLKPDEYTVIGEHGEDRAEAIQADESPQLFKDKVWLRDVWLPSEKLMVTYGVKSERVMKVVEWEGPAKGPYPILGFNDVPGNLLPLPPVSLWRDLHELGNALFRKLSVQADSQKSVQAFAGGNDDSAEDFRKAKDGDGIKYSGSPPVTLKAGGIDQTTLAFYLQTRDLSSYFAGNLDSLGGLAPITQTVGQDKLLSEAASVQLKDMSSKTIDVMRDVFNSIAWYEWHDPVLSRTLEKPIPGTNLKINVPWGKDDRKGKIDLYDLQIDVYSLQDNSPSTKLQKLGLLVQQYVLPLAPLIAQQGGTVDVQAILRMAAKYSDFPELGEIVIFTDNPNVAEEKEPPGMPQQTTRTYERVNRPGATERGKSQILQQAMLGGKPQDSEAASVTRPTS